MKIKGKRILVLAIVVCILLVAISLIIIFKPKKNVTPWGQEIVSADINENEQIEESKARELAVKQFKKIGEGNVNEEGLEVKKIQRRGEEYYYISSKENTVEIKIKGGEITKINSASVK